MADYPKRVDGLEINPAEDGFIIYQPEQDRVHYLNHTAVLVLELCNGKNTAAGIAGQAHINFKRGKRSFL
jgi:hypothetical protein